MSSAKKRELLKVRNEILKQLNLADKRKVEVEQKKSEINRGLAEETNKLVADIKEAERRSLSDVAERHNGVIAAAGDINKALEKVQRQLQLGAGSWPATVVSLREEVAKKSRQLDGLSKLANGLCVHLDPVLGKAKSKEVQQTLYAVNSEDELKTLVPSTSRLRDLTVELKNSKLPLIRLTEEDELALRPPMALFSESQGSVGVDELLLYRTGRTEVKLAASPPQTVAVADRVGDEQGDPESTIKYVGTSGSTICDEYEM